LVSYTARDLKPFTLYQFKIQATNDIGSSPFSKESAEVRTLSAAPSKGIENLKVVPITTTSVKVHWSALNKMFWNGDFATGGYRVFFQQVTEFQSALQEIPKFDVMGIEKEEVVLNDLTQDNNYEISVSPFNSQGVGSPSSPIVVYVGEAVPTGAPREVKAKALSSTEVFLEWKPPKHDMQNGDLLGYKIFYLVISSSNEIGEKVEEEIEVVPASYNSHSLVFLDKFTEYRIQILAFNPAGDGPRSKSVRIKTYQDLPGPPSNLKFNQITMNSLEVSWNQPKNKNGEILGYVVTYETTEDNESKY
jgi:protein sidekick